MRLLAAVLCLAPGQVWAHCFHLPPVKVDACLNARFRVIVLDPCMAGVGPWYLYFPYDAHFMSPAPVHGFPNWPQNMVPAPAQGLGPTPLPPPAQGQPPTPLPPPTSPEPKNGAPDKGTPPAGPEVPPEPSRSQSFYNGPPRPAPQPFAPYQQSVPSYWYPPRY